MESLIKSYCNFQILAWQMNNLMLPTSDENNVFHARLDLSIRATLDSLRDDPSDGHNILIKGIKSLIEICGLCTGVGVVHSKILAFKSNLIDLEKLEIKRESER